jgi:adenylate kinase
MSKRRTRADSILIEFMRQRLSQPDTAKCWLLEGYPRTAFSGRGVGFLTGGIGSATTLGNYLEVPESVMMSRSLKRSRTSPSIDAVDSRPDDNPKIVAVAA